MLRNKCHINKLIVKIEVEDCRGVELLLSYDGGGQKGIFRTASQSRALGVAV